MCNNLITKQLQHPPKTLFSDLQIAFYNIKLVNIFHANTSFSESSGFWSDKVCHLCLEFEAMSHGGTERTEDY